MSPETTSKNLYLTKGNSATPFLLFSVPWGDTQSEKQILIIPSPLWPCDGKCLALISAHPTSLYAQTLQPLIFFLLFIYLCTSLIIRSLYFSVLFFIPREQSHSQVTKRKHVLSPQHQKICFVSFCFVFFSASFWKSYSSYRYPIKTFIVQVQHVSLQQYAVPLHFYSSTPATATSRGIIFWNI